MRNLMRRIAVALGLAAVVAVALAIELAVTVGLGKVLAGATAQGAPHPTSIVASTKERA